MTNRLFIFGVGYAGLQIARLALREGWSVAGTATTEGKVEQLRAEGIVAELFAPPDFPLSAPFAAATHILSTIPPDQSGDPAVQQCIGCFRNKKPQAAWIGYLSTTGVYGDTGGAWVDETAAPRPGPARSRHRLAADLRARAQRPRPDRGRHGAPGRQAGPGLLPYPRRGSGPRRACLDVAAGAATRRRLQRQR